MQLLKSFNNIGRGTLPLREAPGILPDLKEYSSVSLNDNVFYTAQAEKLQGSPGQHNGYLGIEFFDEQPI